MTPRDVAGLTDWQVEHLYAGPFLEWVGRLSGRRAAPPAAVPPPADRPDYWEELVSNLEAAGVGGRAAAEAEAARLDAAYRDLLAAQAAERRPPE